MGAAIAASLTGVGAGEEEETGEADLGLSEAIYRLVPIVTPLRRSMKTVSLHPSRLVIQ